MYDALERHVVAADGTRIAWHRHNSGGRGGPGDGAADARPSVLLTNGLSTTDNFWQHVVRGLVPEYRVAHWDYRGHGRSEVARSGDYAVRTHADDLARVAEAVQCDGAFAGAPVHVAFSMGVTVLLELYRARPERVRAMVLIAGGADHPYASSAVMRVPGVRAALRRSLRAVAPVVPRAAPLARRIAASKAIYPLARATGAIGAAAPRAEVEHFFRAVGAMDLRAYWESLRSLMDARASDVLPRVRVPVLVIAPERDVMALQGDLEALRRGIPDAAWMQVAGTGHAMLLEAGALVATRIRTFVESL